MSQSATISNQTKRWQEMDAAHHLHPFTTHKDLAQKGARVITHAEGVYLYDSEGNRLIDAMALIAPNVNSCCRGNFAPDCRPRNQVHHTRL